MSHQLPPPQFDGDNPDPVDGDIWYNTATGVLRKKQGGVISNLDTGGIGSGHYEPLTNGIVATPELIFALGDCIMAWVV